MTNETNSLTCNLDPMDAREEIAKLGLRLRMERDLFHAGPRESNRKLCATTARKIRKLTRGLSREASATRRAALVELGANETTRRAHALASGAADKIIAGPSSTSGTFQGSGYVLQRAAEDLRAAADLLESMM
jgi:hypothetical protein